MLRVTEVARGPSEVTLRVEGQIVADWAAFLDRQCRALLETFGRVRLDLSGVTFLDRRGVAVLTGLPPGRLRIENCPPLIQELLEQDGAGYETPDGTGSGSPGAP